MIYPLIVPRTVNHIDFINPVRDECKTLWDVLRFLVFQSFEEFRKKSPECTVYRCYDPKLRNKCASTGVSNKVKKNLPWPGILLKNSQKINKTLKKIGLRKWNFFGVKEFFPWILISKMDVKMNLRVITKNHAADLKIGSPFKSILEPIALTSPSRQPGS